MLLQITDENYKEILKSDKLVIIDVYATCVNRVLLLRQSWISYQKNIQRKF